MSILIKQRGRLFPLYVPKTLKVVYVWGKGLGVFANRNFAEGETVIRFKAEVVRNSDASPEAVQIDARHSFDTKWLVVEAFVNHSCEPNTKLDVGKKRYVAVKRIKKNEEITFNYNTTEWDSKGKGFRCACGSRHCCGMVRGLKYLPRKEQVRLAPYLVPFLAAKVK